MKKLNLLFFSLFLCISAGFSQLLTQSVPGDYTWTCPDGVTTVQIECWGGGGAGGGSVDLVTPGNPIYGNGGGGGAGGAYVKHTSVSVVPGTVYSYTVGAGGTGVVAAKGNDGGNTTFGTTLVAFGGGGGLVATKNATLDGPIASSLGGTCPTPTTGTVNYAGGKGGDSKNSTGYYSGGGGAGADSGGAGQAASTTSTGGGVAGSNGGGAGGNGKSGGGAIGDPGAVVGGGGAGSTTGNGDTRRVGGAGAAGKIIISTVVATGISTQSTENVISVYPNPSTDRIQTSNVVSEIALYSLQGQLVRSSRNTSSLNVSDIASGMYIVRLTGKSGNKQSTKLEIVN